MQTASLHPILSTLAERPYEELSEGERLLYEALAGPMDEGEVHDIRVLIGRYYGLKASDGISELFEERGWTSELLDRVISGESTWDDLP